ncbi:hypothetical protein BIV57_03430 [Mangrovactinospora gilvigrisea]|uniref:Uncharacterized protein n=2 Tax=Mangrovactinospora gilvigrisea TaxID=1428644 RepID=A0A1J7BJE6_9ACTN|nr:hypothetical protein BIV57_03430 [Mangrovactinospora gilvigrisea]
MVVGGTAGTALALGGAGKALNNTNAKIHEAAKHPKPKPTATLPDASPSPTPTPSPSSSAKSLGTNTYAKRGPITPKIYSSVYQFGGPKIIRTSTRQSAKCLDYVQTKAPSRPDFTAQDCEKATQATYVSEKKDAYMSVTVFQFKDPEHRKALEDAIDLQKDGSPNIYFRPPAGYDFSKVNSKTTLYTVFKSDSECLVIGQAIFADGRNASSKDDSDTLQSWANLSGSDAAMNLATVYQKMSNKTPSSS